MMVRIWDVIGAGLWHRGTGISTDGVEQGRTRVEGDMVLSQTEWLLDPFGKLAGPMETLWDTGMGRAAACPFPCLPLTRPSHSACCRRNRALSPNSYIEALTSGRACRR